MATGATGAGPEPLGASAARTHEPWARVRALGLGCAARCARRGRHPRVDYHPGPTAAPSRAPRRAPQPKGSDPSPWLMCPCSRGAQGLGPGACAPCGHVFSQERYRNHIYNNCNLGSVISRQGGVFFRKRTLEKTASTVFRKTKKTRNAIPINFPVVSRLDLCSEARS